MAKAYALVDCNNFYASCERAFNPALEGKPIAILSNNDGCIISRSKEAKEVGIEMTAPEFKCRDLLKKHNVQVFSSNYALYGDMSHRVMETLRSLTHDIEIYSIDEAFAELSTHTFKDLDAYGRYIKDTIFKWTGLPVSVGIGPTKTLAKTANQIAKKNVQMNGVLNLCDHPDIDSLLEKVPLRSVWGIGHGLTVRLNRYDIFNALHLKRRIENRKWVRKHLNVTGLRTVLELNGKPCIPLENSIEARKGIMTSRSFGKPVFDRHLLEEAVATYMSRAAEKLRAQYSVASLASVSLITNKHDNIRGKYKYGMSFSLNVPTAHTPTLIAHAKHCVRKVYEPGLKYIKAAVMLTGIVPNSEVQMDLFQPHLYTKRQHQLMESIDAINAYYGRNTTAFAATGLHKKEGIKNQWAMNQNYLSKKYTTRWDELMVAKAK